MSKTLHPDVVVAQWDILFDQTPLEIEHRANLQALIQQTLPPLSVESIWFSADLYTKTAIQLRGVDYQTLTASVLHFLNNVRDDALPERLTKTKTSHPLAAALRTIATTVIHSTQTPEYIECLLSIADPASFNNPAFEAEIFYTHILAVRDTLRLIDHNRDVLDPTMKLTVSECAVRLLDTLEKHEFDTLCEMGYQVRQTVNEKYKLSTTINLIQGELPLGARCKSRHAAHEDDQTISHHPNRTNTVKTPLVIDPLFSPQDQHTLQRHYRNQHTKHIKDDAFDAPMLPFNITPTVILFNPPHCPDADADADADQADSNETPDFEITFPTALKTVEEKERYTKRLQNILAAQQVVSTSDMHRLSSQQVIEEILMMAHLEHPLLAVFSFLLYSTGISPKRVSGLRVSTAEPTEEILHLHPFTGILRYKVLHCAATIDPIHNTDLDGTSNIAPNHLMQLAIPRSIVAFITSLDNEQPFLSVDDAFKRMKRKVQKDTGFRVHPLRMYSTSCHSFDRSLFNRLESAYKQGTVGFENAAGSAYRVINLNDIHHKQSSCLSYALKQLQTEWRLHPQYREGTFPAYLHVSPSLIRFDQSIGSRRYAPLNRLQPLFKAIRQKAKQLKTTLNKDCNIKSLQGLLDLINLQHLVYWFLLHIHTLGRPIGAKTQLAFHQGYIWCSDKASHAFRERKCIAVIDPLHLSSNLFIRQQQQVIDSLAHLRQFQDITLEGSILNTNKAFPLPLYFSTDHTTMGKPLPKRKGQPNPVKVVTGNIMTPKRLQTCLNTLGFQSLFPHPANLFRHVASTELSKQCSDALVEEALGHKHVGREYWSPLSSANPKHLRALIPMIEQWVSDMDVKPIDIKIKIFEGVYALN